MHIMRKRSRISCTFDSSSFDMFCCGFLSPNFMAEELTREVEHWKRVAQHHKQQEAQTREELNKANQRR